MDSKCSAHDGDRHSAGKHTAWHDPVTDRKGDDRTYSGHHWSDRARTIGRRDLRSDFWDMLAAQQYLCTDTSFVCIFSVFEYDRLSRLCKGSLGIGRMPYHDRSGSGLALDLTEKMQM